MWYNKYNNKQEFYSDVVIMKKLVAVVLVFVCILALSGCTTLKQEDLFRRIA